MAADDWRYATNRRDADERGYTGDNPRSAWPQWGAGRNSASADRGADGLRPSGAVRPPQTRRHGAGDLPKPVHFVSAAVSSSSDEHGDSRNPASSSSVDLSRQATSPPPEPEPEPGSLASNPVVAHMMKRMNYKEGSGLGRHGQGIIAPIEVALRPKNAGLGSVERPLIGGADGLPPPSDENWPKWDEAGGARKRKRDRDVVVHDKILARRLDLEQSAAEAVVRVQKALARAARWPATSSGLGDLQRRGDEMAAAAAITKAMKWVQEQSASGTLTTRELIREFAVLKEKCPREYTTYRLGDTARAIVAPLLRAAFQRWEPLEDPWRALETVTTLRDMLLDDGSAMSPYGSLVDDVVVAPALASAAATWDAKDPEPMIRFLETWGDALPLPAIQRLLEQVVMPKLSAAVEWWELGWEPSPPCHVWVLRWIPLLGRWLEPLYVTVRYKLGRALVGWHTARALADYDMVLPWRDAFGPVAWEEFVHLHVVPYLRHGLRALRVTPPKQDDAGFAGVMRWASVVSVHDMTHLLEEEFFGKWQDALRRWLWAARPTAKEAMAWHEGWKRLLTPELLAEERVSVPIEAGLQKINRTAQGLGIYRRERGQQASETHSYRSRSRRRAVVGSRSNKRHW